MKVETLDHLFQGVPGLIASYLIPHENGAILVESGPGSTTGNLIAALKRHGYQPGDITDLLVTHIHLDHAGASGWFASQGVNVHVHEIGYKHLLDPSVLVSSAARIYGDQMDTLWGQMLPVPESRLFSLQDGDVLEIGGLEIRALDTPGHAYHHMAYHAGDIVFTGDVGGMRISDDPYLIVPVPPPEFDLDKWWGSFYRLKALDVNRLAPTHFGIYEEVSEHLALLENMLKDLDAWMTVHMPAGPGVDEIEKKITAWFEQRAKNAGLSENLLKAYEIANPSWTNAAGIHRYWRKFRSS